MPGLIDINGAPLSLVANSAVITTISVVKIVSHNRIEFNYNDSGSYNGIITNGKIWWATDVMTTHILPWWCAPPIPIPSRQQVQEAISGLLDDKL